MKVDLRQQQNKDLHQEVIGLIPAGGRATRIAPLPCSKELYPIGFMHVDRDRPVRPKVVCHYLLEKMRFAGITKAYIILRQGKWDIPAYLGDGTILDMYTGYLMMGVPYGVPYTLDQAYPFIQNALVVLGFLDMLFTREDVFVQVLARQALSNDDAVLGLFPSERPQKVDMVDVDDDGRIREIVIKPRQTRLRFTWGISAWTPAFTNFMHKYLAPLRKSAADQPELFVGDVIQAAIHDGFHVEGVHVSNSPFLDIGTPEDLVRAVRDFQALDRP